jgi:hypothetical protein
MAATKFEKLLFPESPLLTPYVVIERFEGAVRFYGKDLVLTDRRFQKAREMHATAIFLLGRSKLVVGNEKYWLAPSYDEVPDVYAYRFQPHPDIPDGQQTVQYFIEVTDWEAHSKETLSERVKNKLAGKAYPFHFILLVHAKKDIAVDMDAEYAEIQKQGLPIMEAWMTATLANKGDGWQALFSMGTPKIGCDFSLKALVLENKGQIPGALLLDLHKKGNQTEIFSYLYKFEFPPLS